MDLGVCVTKTTELPNQQFEKKKSNEHVDSTKVVLDILGKQGIFSISYLKSLHIEIFIFWQTIVLPWELML